MLHISKKEQGERPQDRPRRARNTAGSSTPSDLEDRKLWDEHMAARETMLDRCSTRWAPWHRHPGRPQMGPQCRDCCDRPGNARRAWTRKYPGRPGDPEKLRDRLGLGNRGGRWTVTSWPKIHSRGSSGGAGVLRLFWNRSRACSTTRVVRGWRSGLIGDERARRVFVMRKMPRQSVAVLDRTAPRLAPASASSDGRHRPASVMQAVGPARQRLAVAAAPFAAAR